MPLIQVKVFERVKAFAGNRHDGHRDRPQADPHKTFVIVFGRALGSQREHPPVSNRQAGYHTIRAARAGPAHHCNQAFFPRYFATVRNFAGPSGCPLTASARAVC